MFRYRMIYALVLAFSIVFYSVYSPWFSYYLLIFLLLLLPLDLIISLPGMLCKSIDISAPYFLEKDSYGVVTLRVIHKKPFPVRCCVVKLYEIGDDVYLRHKVLAAPGETVKNEIITDTSRTGLTVFQIKRIEPVSLLGLFSVRIKISKKQSILILPPARKPTQAPPLPRGFILIPKPGGGFSEDHEIRTYIPGDPVRTIHWKLSAKFNSLVIREPLIPIQQSRLVHLLAWENAAERDIALSHLRWITGFLLEKGITFYVRYADKHLTEHITDETDLIDFLHHVLDNTSIVKHIRLPKTSRFTWVYTVSGKYSSQTSLPFDCAGDAL